MILRELLNSAKPNIVECRVAIILPDGDTFDSVLANCAYVDGVLRGDEYSLDTEIDTFSISPDGVLTTWESPRVLSFANSDEKLKAIE